MYAVDRAYTLTGVFKVSHKAIPNNFFCLYGCIKNLRTGYEGEVLYIFCFIVVAKI